MTIISVGLLEAMSHHEDRKETDGQNHAHPRPAEIWAGLMTDQTGLVKVAHLQEGIRGVRRRAVEAQEMMPGEVETHRKAPVADGETLAVKLTLGEIRLDLPTYGATSRLLMLQALVPKSQPRLRLILGDRRNPAQLLQQRSQLRLGVMMIIMLGKQKASGIRA